MEVKRTVPDDDYLILNKSNIHDKVYYDLRDRTDLPSNLCIRAYSKAVEAMKSPLPTVRRATVARFRASTNRLPFTTSGR